MKRGAAPLLLIAGFLTVILLPYIQEKLPWFRKNGRVQKYTLYLFFVVSAFVIVFAIINIAINTALLIQASRETLIWHFTQWYTCFFAVLLAWLFYILRSKRPAVYGFVEVIVAIGSIVGAIYITTDSLFSITFALLTGIYVFVRGLDNINKGVPEWMESAWSKAMCGPSERAVKRQAAIVQPAE